MNELRVIFRLFRDGVWSSENLLVAGYEARKGDEIRDLSVEVPGKVTLIHAVHVQEVDVRQES